MGKLKFPDGAEYEYPDSMPDAEVSKLAWQLAEKHQLTPTRRTIEGGLKRGLTDTAGFIANAFQTAPAVSEKSAEKMGMDLETYRHKTRPYGQRIEELAGVPEPQSPSEALGQSVIAGGVGGLLFGGRPSGAVDAVRQIVSGVSAGGGAEMMGQQFGQNPFARFLGSLIGGATPGALESTGRAAARLATGRSGRTPGRIQEALPGVGPREFKEARARQTTGQAAGVSLLPVQALPGNPPLLGLQESLTPSQSILSSALGRQTVQGREAAERMASAQGPSVTLPEAALGAQKTVTKGMEGLRQERTAAVRPEYEFRSKNVPASLVAATYADLDKSIRAAGGEGMKSNAVVRELVTMRDQLLLGIGPNGQPKFNRSAQNLDNVFKVHEHKLRMPDLAQQGISRDLARQIRAGLDKLEKTLDIMQVDRATGKTKYERFTQTKIVPQKEGLGGQIAGQRGYVEGQGPKDLTNVLFDVKVTSPKMVRETADLMAKADPQAFPALLRSSLEHKIEEAFKGPGDAQNSRGLEKFVDSIWKGQKRGNLLEAIRASARSAGKTTKEQAAIAAGADNLLHTLDLASKGRGGLKGFEEEPQISGVQLATKAAGAAIYAPQAAGTAVQLEKGFGMKRSNREIARILADTSPEGLALLEKMATKRPSEVWQTISRATAPIAATQINPRERN